MVVVVVGKCMGRGTNGLVIAALVLATVQAAARGRGKGACLWCRNGPGRGGGCEYCKKTGCILECVYVCKGDRLDRCQRTGNERTVTVCARWPAPMPHLATGATVDSSHSPVLLSTTLSIDRTLDARPRAAAHSQFDRLPHIQTAGGRGAIGRPAVIDLIQLLRNRRRKAAGIGVRHLDTRPQNGASSSTRPPCPPPPRLGRLLRMGLPSPTTPTPQRRRPPLCSLPGRPQRAGAGAGVVHPRRPAPARPPRASF